jgi:hypothetical protein
MEQSDAAARIAGVFDMSGRSVRSVAAPLNGSQLLNLWAFGPAKPRGMSQRFEVPVTLFWKCLFR